MKLLLENWKRYIKEELRPEDYEDFPQKEEEEAEAYLGNPKSIGEFIYTAFREELEKQPDETQAQLWSDRIISDANSKIKKQFPNVKYLGHGVFRTAFTLNKNLIIKVNSSYTTDSGQMMNKDDFMLSRDPKISKIFPRVYSHDPDFNWIVMDLVYPIVTPKEFLSFFPNKNIPTSLINSKTIFYRSILQNSIKYKVFKVTGDKKLKNEVDYIYDTSIKDSLQKEIGSVLTMEEIVIGFNETETFSQVCNAIVKYGLRITEIRPNNTGYTIGEGGEKQFVILDSSIDASIKKAFGEPDLKQQAPPAQMNVGVTAPIKK
jgi:hypothetical protein